MMKIASVSLFLLIGVATADSMIVSGEQFSNCG